MDRPIEADYINEEEVKVKAEPFKVDETLLPNTPNAKKHVLKIEEYLDKCFPNRPQDAMHEVALTIWRIGKEF